MRYLALIFCIFFFSSAYCHTDKLYIHPKSIDKRDDIFHIHTGHNVWISTNLIDYDSKGVFTLKSDIKVSSFEKRMQYEREWKCPYCHRYYAWGKACDSDDCPSRFTESY